MKKVLLVSLLIASMVTACSVSYKFNASSINYDKTKTIDIKDFLNQAPLVYPPLIQEFNEKLKDVYNRNTKLQFVDGNGDLELEGEITRYDLMPMSVRQDALAAQTRLTMSVRIRFRNNVEDNKDKEETFTAYQDFDSSQMLTDVQDQLIEELIKELVDQIFNITTSDW